MDSYYTVVIACDLRFKPNANPELNYV